MKLIYTKKKFLFETPEQLQDKMVEYLEWVKSENNPYSISFCKNCGSIAPKEPCCNNQALEYKLMQKAPYEIIRPSIYGFAAYCGMGDATIYNYKTKPGFKEVIEWFKNILQMDLEQLLLSPFNRNVAGAKFIAINNFGWKEQTDVNYNGNIPVAFINDISPKIAIENTDDEGEKQWLK